MKKLCVIVVLCCFFAGCSNDQGMEKAVLLRNRLSQENGCSFRCTITADYVDSFSTFQLDCEVVSDGGVGFTVISPDSISGVCGVVDGQGGKLTFDSHILTFPLLADGWLSPVSTPWIVIEALRGGYIRSCGAEDSVTRITLDDTFAGQTLQVDVWLQEDLIIDSCEILWEGRKILSMDVESFIWL